MIDKNKKILILGAYGTLGKQLVPALEKSGYNKLLFPTRNMCDLLSPFSYEQYFHAERPDAVINLAAKKTNINLCYHYPASICRETLLMNIATLEMCKKYEVSKLINIITSCAYDGVTALLEEKNFYEGSPHPSVMAHGLAKRSVAFLGESYAHQYHMNVVNVAMNTFFGCGDWSKPNSLKFLDALIVKIVDAKLLKLKQVNIWGSGKPKREVLFVPDAAMGLLEVLEKYDSSELLNVGSGIDYSITEYAELIRDLVKWKGVFKYETDRPDGQMIKKFDCEKIKRELNWTPPTNIEDAIKKTILDYTEYAKKKERKSYPLV